MILTWMCSFKESRRFHREFTHGVLQMAQTQAQVRPAAVFTAAYSKWWLSEGFTLNGVTNVHVSINSKGLTFPQYSVCGSLQWLRRKTCLSRTWWDETGVKIKQRKRNRSQQTENTLRNMIYPHLHTHSTDAGRRVSRCTAVSESLR